MARFRPTPAGVHDSPEWKAAGGFLRTIHRILRPVSGELELPPGCDGDPLAVTLQAKLAEIGAHYREEECRALADEALRTKLWRIRKVERGEALVIPAFPPSFVEKCKAEGRGAQGGERGAKRTARWRANKDLRAALAALAEDESDDALDEQLTRALEKLAKDDPEKARRLARKLKGGVTQTVTDASHVTPKQEPPAPPPPAPGDPFRGSRDEGGSVDAERHAVTEPAAGGAPGSTADPVDLGRQLRDELKAAGPAFVPAAPDGELAGLAGLVRRGDFTRDNLRLIARHWADEPNSLRSTFSTDKAMREGAPATLGLLLGERDARGGYAGHGLRKALTRALAWERKRGVGPGPAKVPGPSPVELARAAWERDCEDRRSRGFVTLNFEAWLTGGNDLHREEARAWMARAARKPKGATG